MDIDQDAFKALTQTYLDKWKCHPDGEIFFTHSSLLWPLTRGAEKLMLKIVNPDDDEANSGETLAYFSGYGAVKIIESDAHVMLLERISDSANTTSLEDMVLNGQDDQATHIICDVIEQLHSVPHDIPAPQSLLPFRQRSHTMREHMREGRVAAKDLPLFQKAYDMYDDIVAAAEGTERVLHGDIHHFNLIHSDSRGWLAIDPKGIWGPRVYEYANTLCNPYKHQNIVGTINRMDRQAGIIAERAGLDKDILLNFTFLHACQCSAWSLHDPDQDYWLACVHTAAHLAGIDFQ